MDRTTVFAAFSSVLVASTPDLPERGFEIRAMDDQANNLLQTVNLVAAKLDEARAILQQRSALFHDSEKRVYDDTFQHTQDLICNVAALAERSPVDGSPSGGKTEERGRVGYTLRDSQNVQLSLSHLRSAREELDSTINHLKFRARPRFQPPAGHEPPHDSPPPGVLEQSPPPTYEESVKHFLTEGRRRNMARRASAMSLAANANQPTQHQRPRPSSALSDPLPYSRTIPQLDIPELAAEEAVRPNSMPSYRENDLNYLPSRHRSTSYRLSPDMSIPEVMQSEEEQPQQYNINLSPKSSHSTSSSMDARSDNGRSPLTMQGGRVGSGKKTGRARAESWLAARAVG